MSGLFQDVRYGLRMLVKNPGFTAVAVLTLALGIGANTAIFSVVNAVLLKPLPYPDPDRLVLIWDTIPNYPGELVAVTGPDIQDWQDRNQSFEGMAAIYDSNKTLTGSGEPLAFEGLEVSPNVFQVLGIQPLLGRSFTPDEGTAGHTRIVILSYGAWQRILGGDRNVVGRKIILSGESHEVVGVMPQSLQFPAVYGREPRFWIPVNRDTPDWKEGRGSHHFRLLARLKKGVPLSKAAAEMETLSGQIAQQYPQTNTGVIAKVKGLHEQLTGNVRPTLLVLFAAVGFLLLIASANVANLLLTKSLGRGREITIRMAVGSGLGRIVRQLLTESILLFLLGGLAGLVAGFAAMRLLVSLAPARSLPQGFSIQFDTRVFAFGFAVALVTGILAGLAPALHASRLNVQDTLKEAGPTVTRARSYSRGVFTICEIGLALVMLIGAGLAIKSLVRLLGVPLGFDPRNVLIVRVQLPKVRYPNPLNQIAFYQNLLERVRVLPGDVSGAAATELPLHGGDSSPIYIEGQAAPKNAWSGPAVQVCQVTPGYFRTLLIPFLSGRDFTLADTVESPKVAIINETMARRFWPATDAVGRRFASTLEDKVWYTVVGVVGDARESGLRAPVSPEAYFPETQLTSSSLYLMVRTANDPLRQVSAIRGALNSIDKDLPASDPRSLRELVSDSSANERFITLLLSLFAGSALTMASVGMFGVVAYNVAQRTHEIGIRMALGAERSDVLRLVVGKAFALTLLGVGLGVVGALGLTRFLKGLLYEVKPTDPLTFASVAVLLMLVLFWRAMSPRDERRRSIPWWRSGTNKAVSIQISSCWA
jgi:putative ABC transport system permease protein